VADKKSRRVRDFLLRQQAQTILRIGQVDRAHQFIIGGNAMVTKIRLQEVQQAGHGFLSK
jgi:hypothetical protein